MSIKYPGYFIDDVFTTAQQPAVHEKKEKNRPVLLLSGDAYTTAPQQAVHEERKKEDKRK